MIRALAARWLRCRLDGALTRWLRRYAAPGRTTRQGYVPIDELEEVEWLD